MRTRPEAGTVRRGSAGVNLALATAAFTLLFWAWNLIGPLAPAYSAELGLDPTQTSVLIACPVLVGSLGRIPAGALTDRYGGRVMLAGICFVTVVPVVLLGVFGTSYLLLLVFGFLLGIAGASFAVGVPFVNSWYAPERRGFATGLFGAGMGGTALSAFLTPYLAEAVGRVQTHLLMAAALAAMGVLVLAVCRTAPDRRPSAQPILPRMREALGLRATWQNILLYAVAFGGFVAFSTYLPTLLSNDYGFSQTEAGLRAAGFSLVAVVARPVGGILSDRVGPVRVCLTSFVGTAAMAVVMMLDLPPEIPAGTVFVLMAAFLGLGTGGVFALVARLVEPSRVGTVTGMVGAAGGLGGYFPPLVMGVVFQATGAYTVGFALLALVALGTAVYTARAFTDVE